MPPWRSRWSGVRLVRIPIPGASEGARSIWKVEHSITCTRVLSGTGSARMAVPILPPIATSRPATCNKWAIKAVVVDLPLVPVIATQGASGEIRALCRKNNSISPMISTRADCAFSTTGCGAGWVSGTPGDRISASCPSKPCCNGSAMAKPASAALSRAACLSSHANTRAPPARKASAVTRPEPPSPNTVTVLPEKQVTGVMLTSASMSQGQPARTPPR